MRLVKTSGIVAKFEKIILHVELHQIFHGNIFSVKKKKHGFRRVFGVNTYLRILKYNLHFCLTQIQQKLCKI